MKVICGDRRSRTAPSGPAGRGVHSVSADVDRLLGPKSLDQLGVLETQIARKLQSNEPVDVEYWEQLLRSISVYKAKAELKDIYKSVIDGRLQALRLQQVEEAELVARKLSVLSAAYASAPTAATLAGNGIGSADLTVPTINYTKHLDPEPLLKTRVEDKGLDVVEEADFLSKIVSSIPGPVSIIRPLKFYVRQGRDKRR